MGGYIWIFVGISLIAFVLNIFKNKLCFIVWNLSNIGFIINFCLEKNWPFVVLWIFYFLINCYGYHEWKEQEEKEDDYE